MKQQLRLWLLIWTVLGVCSCTGAPPSTGVAGPFKMDQSAAVHIGQLLQQDGSQLAYADLMEIYTIMSKAGSPIPRMHELLSEMIHKRNTHPRVDQMILIFSAKAMGESHFEITGVGDLFDAILDQQERLNMWVISFVADGIGRYPFLIPQGDRLVDRLDAILESMRRSTDHSKESYGYHFLPPPYQPLVKSYLAGIKEKRLREQERYRYYFLIRQNIREEDIAASISYLLSQTRTGTGAPCTMLMKCLLKLQDQIPLK